MLVVATHGRLMRAGGVAIAAETEAGAVDVREAAGAADVAEAVVDAADAVAVAAGAAVMVAAAVVDATNGLTTFATDSRGFSRIDNRKATILVVAFFAVITWLDPPSHNKREKCAATLFDLPVQFLPVQFPPLVTTNTFGLFAVPLGVVTSILPL